MGLYTKVAGAWQEIGVDGGGGMSWAKVSGVTPTEYTDPSGTVMQVYKFTANGTLTVAETGQAIVLAVGGGGGGGSSAGSGGDGGVVVHSPLFVLPAGTHAVTIGAGGNNGATDQAGVQGDPTSLGTLVTAAGGVGGGGWLTAKPGNGPRYRIRIDSATTVSEFAVGGAQGGGNGVVGAAGAANTGNGGGGGGGAGALGGKGGSGVLYVVVPKAA